MATDDVEALEEPQCQQDLTTKPPPKASRLNSAGEPVDDAAATDRAAPAALSVAGLDRRREAAVEHDSVDQPERAVQDEQPSQRGVGETPASPAIDRQPAASAPSAADQNEPTRL